MASPGWQQLWRDTVPSLKDGLPLTRSVDSRKVRAGQLDAQALDDDLVNLLHEPLSRSLSMLTDEGSMPFEPEFILLLKSLIFKYSILDTCASYGSRLQGLQYSNKLHPRGLPRRSLLYLFAFSVLLPYAHTRFRNHALSKSWPDLPAADPRRRMWSVLSISETTHSLLATLSFVVFLWNGRFRSISERLAGIFLTPISPSSSREVSYDFMNRQMAWHAFTEFLLFAVPLIQWSRNLKKLKKVILARAPTSRFLQAGPSKVKRYLGLLLDECAICHERAGKPVSQGAGGLIGRRHPIQTTYVTSCGHRFCYFCVSEQILQAADEDSYWECLRCSRPVYNILRDHEDEEDDEQGTVILGM